MLVCPCKTSRVERGAEGRFPTGSHILTRKGHRDACSCSQGEPESVDTGWLQLCLTSCWWLGTSRGEMGVSMPWKSSRTTHQGFCPPEPLVKYVPAYNCLLPGFSSQRFLFFLSNEGSEETGVRPHISIQRMDMQNMWKEYQELKWS